MTAKERAKQDYGALSGRRFHKDEHVRKQEQSSMHRNQGMEVKRKGWISQRRLYNRITTKKPKTGCLWRGGLYKMHVRERHVDSRTYKCPSPVKSLLCRLQKAMQIFDVLKCLIYTSGM